MKKSILVTVDRAETRVAVLEAEGTPARLQAKGRQAKGKGDWKVSEIYVERSSYRSIVGNIYKGRVDNVLPGLEAAFVDIGLDRNGFLHVDEIVTADGKPVPKRGRGQGRRIDELIKPGQELVVQVIKDPLKTKGARLTMQLSIPARYLVFMPSGAGIGVSRRLGDKERKRLRKLADKVETERGGLIVRTAAHGAQQEDLEREIGYLYKLEEILSRRAEPAQAPAMIFQEADLAVRVVRDVFLEEFDRAIIDDDKQLQRVVSFFQRTAPELVDHVEAHDGKEPLFEQWGVDEAIESTLSRRVDLPSGGYLIIDYAEALTVIDINTGSFTGRGAGRLEDTITKVNVEAASEVVRQLKLRDIGGIIVIDFIDMARARNRDEVLKTLRAALEEDQTKTYVVEISPLGLVEMTRQNVTEGVREILTEGCPTCGGDAVVKSAETVAIDIVRRLGDVIRKDPDPDAYLIRCHPRVAAHLVDPEYGLPELEEQTGKHFQFEGGVALHIDTFDVVDSGSMSEITERALPFREGDEVLVSIEEPHMYDPTGAIAKVDGYIVAVAEAADAVGQQRLVRIERVSRSEAEAVLVDAPPAPSEDEQEVQSSTSTRRRGRRGGRRRSPATKGSGADSTD
ncbi:MAG: Rne/Rng family ribonuclease [Solirubrobacterales bacterium]